MAKARSVITVGTFDGVHRGHQALVRTARHEADKAGAEVVALVFDPHALEVLRPEAAPPRLSTFEQRSTWMQAAGADRVVRIKPDRQWLSGTPESFVDLLVSTYEMGTIVEGHDFRFGQGRAGDMSMLAGLGEARGFTTHAVEAATVTLSDHSVVAAKSTMARWLLDKGRVHDASIVLGRPYTVSGTVVRGDRRGRTIGYPTANVDTPCMIPADGVYAGRAVLPDGSTPLAAINVGTRPTFDGVGRRIEVFLLDIPTPRTHDEEPDWRIAGLDEYGWPIELTFESWIRDDIRFDSIQDLVQQIARDCTRVREVMNRVSIGIRDVSVEARA